MSPQFPLWASPSGCLYGGCCLLPEWVIQKRTCIQDKLQSLFPEVTHLHFCVCLVSHLNTVIVWARSTQGWEYQEMWFSWGHLEGWLPYPLIHHANLSSYDLSSVTVSELFGLCTLPVCSVQFSSVTQSCPILCDPMNRSTPGLPVHQKLLEFTQTQVSDTIQPSQPLSSPSPPAPNPSQHQSPFQWVSSARSTQFLFIRWYSSKSLLRPGLRFLFLWSFPISKQTDYNGTSCEKSIFSWHILLLLLLFHIFLL